jgi:hypothetical protein
MNEESSQTEEVAKENRCRKLFNIQLSKSKEEGKLNKIFFTKETYEEAIKTMERDGEDLKKKTLLLFIQKK